MPAKQIDFTIVIPALNLRSSLEFVLRALDAQLYPHDSFECVIIDDGSTDGTADFLAQYRSSFPLRYIVNKVSQGRSAARNAGWKYGHGSMIAFLDGDTLPSPNWLADYATASELTQHEVISGSRYCLEVDPKEAAFGQHLAVLAGTPSEELLRGNVAEQFRSLAKAAAPGPYRMKPFELFELQLREACLSSPRSLLCAYSFVGANVTVRRAWLEKINGFDQSLRRGEDTDVGIRLWEIGARFGFTDGAAAYHMASSAEANRHLDPIEATSFFYRHPYKLVLLVYLWFVRQFSDSPQSGHPAFSSLTELTKEVSDESALDIEAEFHRLRQPPIPADCRYTKEELVQFYVDSHHLPPVSITSFLDCAVAQGLYTKQQGSSRLFDFSLVANWLRYSAPLHEYVLKNGNCFRQYKTMFLPQRKVPAPHTLSCRCSYEVKIDAKVLNGRQIHALTNIPLPVDNQVQKVTQFGQCDPPDLLSHRDDSRQMISRYPWPKDRIDICISYEFDCIIKESSGEVNGKYDHSAIRKSYSRPTLSPKDYPKAKMIMKRIGIGRHLEEYDVAKRIYYWILENTAIYEGPSGSNILDAGFGMCVDEAWLFINLCRLSGIPARHRCGSLFGGKQPQVNHETFVHTTVCFSPFTHTWAEAYIAHRGWIPVEFCTLARGRRFLTYRNLYDPELRREIVEETALYDDYYFGNVDPYRIQAGEEANCAHVSFERADAPGTPSWKMRTCLKHNLTCSILQIL
jgi:glycosyltransferase involved in cell wall biosynthesis